MVATSSEARWGSNVERSVVATGDCISKVTCFRVTCHCQVKNMASQGGSLEVSGDSSSNLGTCDMSIRRSAGARSRRQMAANHRRKTDG